ncbi:MAG: TetR/AcrR family transcriptional regulator [Desulfobacterales bacterium]|nr:TetR/AcrR family transcriptional regulator [Desulfobacterales bacterium]
MEKHYKEAFEKIAEEKKERIMAAAAAEFAAKGFGTANINVIARRAGVSIGAMYNYFASKEDLFLTVIDRAYHILEGVLDQVRTAEGDIFEKLESMFRAAQKYSKRYPELNQIYLDMTSEGLAHLSRKLSGKMETISARLYKAMLAEAQDNGLVDKGIDCDVTAFFLDNLILLLQYSYTSEYFKERMKIFVGPDALENDEKVVAGLMRLVRGALGACPDGK